MKLQTLAKPSEQRWESNNRLQSEIQDRRRELELLRAKIRRMSQADQRFSALVTALLELMDA